ncbi:hypothetical protein Athai_17690 [Actinocatenispora thailandica]|uniref:Uncharacterized protein n=1 Tax=Actinocatenispora thailandica TaxID=227318 RepID=A0A7R7HW20_9ACTN|nr:hypothetical protein [Actinocatenispora thailandica]BCJ34266.1 hypothetical protein Athai_17690 [Actinocatenispora thailandica]
MDLDAVADQLYALSPSEFTAARTDREKAARSDGERALAARIHALRRPTVAAWAGNLLARTRSAQAQRLLGLGEELRAAYRDLDGSRIRALSAEQRRLIPVLVGDAARLAAAAGHPLGADARREVEQTLHAVVADAQAGQRWIRGRLDRPLATAGLAAVAAPGDAAAAGGEVVELGAAAARRGTSAGRPRRRAGAGRSGTDGPAADRGTAGSAPGHGTGTRRGTEAERALRTSVEARAAAERELADAQSAVRAAERRIAELSSELDRAGREQQAAKERARTARRELTRADRTAQVAQRRAAQHRRPDD